MTLSNRLDVFLARVGWGGGGGAGVWTIWRTWTCLFVESKRTTHFGVPSKEATPAWMSLLAKPK